MGYRFLWGSASLISPVGVRMLWSVTRNVRIWLCCVVQGWYDGGGHQALWKWPCFLFSSSIPGWSHPHLSPHVDLNAHAFPGLSESKEENSVNIWCYPVLWEATLRVACCSQYLQPCMFLWALCFIESFPQKLPNEVVSFWWCFAGECEPMGTDGLPVVQCCLGGWCFIFQMQVYKAILLYPGPWGDFILKLSVLAMNPLPALPLPLTLPLPFQCPSR